VDAKSTNIWQQGWLKAHSLGLEGDLAEAWNTHVDNLIRSHIRIRGEGDYVAWLKNPTLGVYTACLGYQAIFHSKADDDDQGYR
jgi:hypothetical protein